ncbi:YifB family Mg chelatase-like AAA ATPase [Helicobacter rodentium]|uniref:YifB family Mg chelatase-like AAA ATPase n=1 Tax=Helicobacter rodentium TaxID=59617 RepID=UPI00047A3A3B|nr:YifB family Mg chelatase-like AAA ATPase [Helicobacter rodentium]
MGLNLLYCAAQVGLEAKIVEVEVSFTRALPSFSITGLAGNAIQESKQRVQSSLLANNFKFPPLKINVNLSPSDIPKQGSFYDLPIALLIALNGTCNLSEITRQNTDSKPPKIFAFGELGLDGRIKDSSSIYPLLFSLLSKQSDSLFLLPKVAQGFYSKLPNLKAYYVDCLQEAIEILQKLPPLESHPCDLPFLCQEIAGEKYYYTQEFPLDFCDIIGQERAKRAALIATCGFHNLLLEGSAGSGKSMIATRIPYILPPLTLYEILQMAANTLEISPHRPFRNPHNSATKAAILGSAVGQNIKSGEIGMAHLGVLFLDELPHFPKSVLESLREPLQNHYFTISRLQAKITCPTDFMFIGAMNPCPCGNLLSLSKECRCNQKEINAYKSKISEPFWDRLDLFVQMQEGKQSTHRIDSKALQNLVLKAFVFQKQRGQTCFNSRLQGVELERLCVLDSTTKETLEIACEKFGISKRGYDKILRVARTIADLESSTKIQKEHLLEALSFRKI